VLHAVCCCVPGPQLGCHAGSMMWTVVMRALHGGRRLVCDGTSSVTALRPCPARAFSERANSHQQHTRQLSIHTRCLWACLSGAQHRCCTPTECPRFAGSPPSRVAQSRVLLGGKGDHLALAGVVARREG
jgi:hypothetical protein